MFTSKQISALRYMIFSAKNGTELSMRVLAFLIESSEEFTKEVCLSLVADREGYTADEISAAARGVDAMVSCNGTTHLQELLAVMGSDLHSSFHYGDFDPARTDRPFNCDEDLGLFSENMPPRYTFWLAKKHYSKQATLVVATREELERIDLNKPDLY